MNYKVGLIGCDPKGDNCRLLSSKRSLTILDNYLKIKEDINNISNLTYNYKDKITFIEVGGPRPCVGCAGKGIILGLYLLKEYDFFKDKDIIIKKMSDNKWNGLKKAIDYKTFKAVKVNTIYIPDINDDEIELIAKKASELGVNELNIKVLMPKAYFKDHKKFDKENFIKVRKKAEKYIKVFKECKNCSYDAYGVPGQDKRLHERFSC